MVTGWKANRRLKAMEHRLKESERRTKDTQQFLFQKFGDRAEIRVNLEAPAPEMTVSVGKRKAKKPTFLLTLCRLLGKLLP